MPAETDNAFCIACGYPLRLLSENRCPECGRTFDPATPATMNLGRPLRRWQRYILRPVGWPTILLALLGSIGLAYLSGWPHWPPEPWSVLRDEFRWPEPYRLPLTVPDVVFHTSVVLWGTFICFFILRQVARLLVPRVARRANIQGSKPRWRRRIAALAAVLSISCMLFGWEGRIGRRWMARVLTPPSLAPRSAASGTAIGYGEVTPWDEVPVVLTQDQALAVLRNGVVNLPTARERLAALKVLVESAGRAAYPTLVRAAEQEKDPNLLAWELRLIGLCRDPASAAMLAARLQDLRPQVRAAAADAIGILRHPTHSLPVSDNVWGGGPEMVESDPPIGVSVLLSASGPLGHGYLGANLERDLLDGPGISIDPSIRPTLQAMMTDGATTEEREAAARSLVAWPPDRFHLRVAEWGVWISNDGHMALAQSILDEIPPFVHRTGNPTSSFGSYFLYPFITTKPIVHLTSDVPLAADVEVHIREGRPWFGYPCPDDFGVGNEEDNTHGKWLGEAGAWGARPPPVPARFEGGKIAALPDCREGYPWLAPHHRLYSSFRTGNGAPALMYNLGLHWQSLIVSPERRPWMVPPTVPADPRFRWWTRLRDVPSSWVANRGETERFLYYDGPTQMPVPIEVTLDAPAHRLHFLRQPEETNFSLPIEEYPKHPFTPMAATQPSGVADHDGLYIDFRDGVLAGQHVSINSSGPVVLPSTLPLHGDAVIQRFREMLTSYGLTGPEAEGLIAAWTPQFFQTPGKRFVLRMSAADYDRRCPMQVRPTPTEVVRLGLVLTEFDPQPATRPAEGTGTPGR